VLTRLPFFSHSVQTKLLVIPFAAALLTLLIGGLFGAQTHDSFERQVLEDEEAIAKVYVRLAGSYLSSARGAIERSAQAPVMRAPLQLDQVQAREGGIGPGVDPGRRQVLQGILAALPSFEYTLQLTPEGDLYVVEPPLPPEVVAHEHQIFREDYDRVLSLRTTAWSDVHRSAITGRPIVSVAVPIWEPTGQLHSVVAGTLRLDLLADAARSASVGSTGTVMIFDSRGVPIVAPKGESIADRQPMLAHPLVARALTGEFGVTRYFNPLTGQDELGGAFQLAESPWYVVISRAQLDAFAGLDQTLVLLRYLEAFGISVLLLAGFVLARSITSPLRMIAAAADRLRNGDRTSTLPTVRGRDEVSRLSWTLRSLVDALTGQERELISVNASLEQRVAQRTAALAEANQRLERLSVTDGLTGLANRRHFDAQLATEWQRAVRQGAPLVVMMIDVDYFKRFNDQYGHPQGDECLRAVAGALSAVLKRPGDLLARYGGEEFVALLPNTALPVAGRLAEDFRTAMANLGIPHEASTVAWHVTISVGVAGMVPFPGADPAVLLAEADQALYQAKAAGRNQFMIATGPKPAA
jgi:diguanylate cyclase (GGDEF)-like protein